MRLRGTMGDGGEPVAACGAQETPTATQRALALAYAIDRALEAGRYRSAQEAAEALAVTPARVSQVLGLLLLEPGEQEAILEGGVEATPRQLRRSVSSIASREACRLGQ